jgi:peroxiredoxin
MISSTTEPSIPDGPLLAGTSAPDFSLPISPNERASLSGLKGPVGLIFYPNDGGPVCGDELSMFEAANGLFAERGAQLIGIAVDSFWSHVAFRVERKFNFPLLADFNPKGEVARSYGVYREADRITGRALFVLDAQHNVACNFISPIAVSPGVDGALKAVEALA